MKQKFLPKFFNMIIGIGVEILLTLVLMLAAFLIGFIILRLFNR